MSTFKGGLIGCLVASWALAAAAGAAAAEYTWPGSAPCDGTLNACVGAVASGSIIDLAPTGPINESLNVTRSLTLRPLALASTAAGEPLPPPVEGGWGRKGWTLLQLRSAKPAIVRDALATAWRNVAPKKLAATLY